MFAPSVVHFVREMVKRASNKSIASKTISNNRLPLTHTKARAVKQSKAIATSSISMSRKRTKKELPSTHTTPSTPWRPLAVRSSWKKIITQLSPSTPLAKAIESSSSESSELAIRATPSITTFNTTTTISSKKGKKKLTKRSRQTSSASHVKENQLITLPGAIIPMIPGVNSIEAFNLQKQKEAALFRSFRRSVCKKKRTERQAREELENRIREEQKKLWEAKSGRGIWRVVRTKNNSSNRKRNKGKAKHVLKNKRKHINNSKENTISSSKMQSKNERFWEKKRKLSKDVDTIKCSNSKSARESIDAPDTQRHSKLTKAKTKREASKLTNDENVHNGVSNKNVKRNNSTEKRNSKQSHKIIDNKSQGKTNAVKSGLCANSIKRNSSTLPGSNIIAERFKFFKKVTKK